jgi:regulator of RNase E activity RraA
MVIYADDLLHGDLNGVTTIPKEIAVELAAIGDEFVAAEAVILDALRTGTASIERLKEAIAEAQALISRLRKQVSRAGE